MPDFEKLIERKKTMTLEKLLIFGFALAALFAITTVGINMMDKRANQTNDFNTGIDDLGSKNF